MKKIIHIIGGLNRGGAETAVVNSLEYVNWDEFEYVFLCFGHKRDFDYSSEILKYPGCRIEFIDYPNISNPINHIKALSSFFEQESTLVENGTSETILHSYTLLHSALVILAAKNRYPIIVHAHSSSDNSTNSNMIRKLYESLSKQIIRKNKVISVACGSEAGNYLFGKKDFELVYNGINTIDIENSFNYFKLNEKKSTEILSSNQNQIFEIGMFGRLVDVKNHEFIINVIDVLVNKRNNNVKLHIFGQGELQGKLEKIVVEKNLEEYIIFEGLSTNVPKEMMGVDIMVMPSKFEGFPMVLIESQALGLKSIISSNISNEVDLGIDLVEFIDLDIDLWVERIIQLIPLKNQLENKNNHIKEIEENGLSAEKYNSKMEQLYSEIEVLL